MSPLKSHRIISSLFVAAASLALLNACSSVGRDFEAPKLESAGQYRHSDASVAAGELPLDSWTLFHDATLDALELQALRDNHNVQAAAHPHPVVLADVRLASRAVPRTGGRAWVRFDHGWSPLAAQAARGLQQLLLQHFNPAQ